VLQDPTWERSGHTDRGRDGERVPLPWEGEKPPFGFSSGDSSWLPEPVGWAGLTVEKQLEDADSALSLYRRALEIRAKTGDLQATSLTWLGAPDGSLAFRRGPEFVVAVNFAEVSAPMPPGELLLASGPLDGDVLPPNTAVWLRA